MGTVSGLKRTVKKVKFKNNLLAGPALLFFQAVLFLAMGIYFIVNNDRDLEYFSKITSVFLVTVGVISVLSYFFIRKTRMFSTLMLGICYLALGILLWQQTEGVLKTVIYLIGVWVFLNFLWRLFLCYLLKIDGDKGFGRAVCDCVVSLVFAVLIFVLPRESLKLLFVLLGVYLIAYSFTAFGDFLREILKWDLNGNHIKRKIHIPIPVFFTAFLPSKLFNEINNNLNEIEEDGVEVVKEEMQDYKPKVEIFIHMSPKIAFGFGHVDINVNGIVYSYGAYDADSVKFFSIISDGVFAKMPVEKYVDHCLEIDNENIVKYSLYLPDEQVQKIVEYIDSFDKNMYKWQCKKELDPNGEYSDPASNFFCDVGAELYKFKKGKYKTYFAIRTNCVQFVDDLIRSTGLNMVMLNGIVTPGTYYHYLENCFKRKNSFVIKKTIIAGADTSL